MGIFPFQTQKPHHGRQISAVMRTCSAIGSSRSAVMPENG
ncbi:hypothetical protein HMPREF1326_00153 [Akkermansia sp. KLE1605]|nr:hypothetical protein HMPREF1326_00153 [Akkermansia sp. KLE1605]